MAGPAFLVITAGGRFGPPEASRQFAERGWTGMARGSRLVTGAFAGQVVRNTELCLVPPPACDPRAPHDATGWSERPS